MPQLIALTNHYEIIKVPENASAEKIDEAFTQSLRKATSEERAELRESYRILSDPETRKKFDRLLQQERHRERTSERKAEIRAELLATYSRRNEWKLTDLIRMITIERQKQFDEIDNANRISAVDMARHGVSNPNSNYPIETERHGEMRRILVEQIPRFLSQQPTYLQVTHYIDAIRAKMQFEPHEGYPFLELLDKSHKLQQPENTLLTYIRDQNTSTELEFKGAFERWLDNNNRDPDQSSNTKQWFDIYSARFFQWQGAMFASEQLWDSLISFMRLARAAHSGG